MYSKSEPSWVLFLDGGYECSWVCCSVVVFGFFWGVVAKLAVNVLCVSPVHPAQGSPVHLGLAFPSVSVDEFGFVQAVDALS